MTYTYSPGRVKTRVDDYRNQQNEKRDRTDSMDPRVQHADLRRERISTRSLGSHSGNRKRRVTEDQPVHGTGEWRRYTGEVSHNTNRTVPVDPVQPRQAMFSREGIRWNLGFTVIAVLIAILAVILLSELAGIGYTAQKVEMLNRKIAAVTISNTGMENQLRIEANDANVCVEAVRLNLVSSSTVPIIRLTVPDNVNLQLQASSQNSWLTGQK